MSQRIVLLYGGRSGEHEISLISAASVLARLDRSKYDIIPVGMDKQGLCFVNSVEELLNYKESLPVVTPKSIPLPSLIVDGAFALAADVVFPIVHGPLYEDGCLQGLLALANIAYVGCDVLSSSIGMDKEIQRKLASLCDIKCARSNTISSHSTEADFVTFAENTARALGWPLFVKPCAMGSSVGIHKVANLPDLINALHDAKRYDATVIVEEFIAGREIELAVLENPMLHRSPLVSLAGEICVHHPDGFYSYAAKYLESRDSTLHVPTVLATQTLARLQKMAADIFVQLKCKGMARVDFFVNDATDEIYFNEINTIPGFTSISMYPKLWEISGIDYTELLDRLIEQAITHHSYRKHQITHYQ